mmetsp:Transcript_37972/g.27962  ORF Transcript_37972/g.27962 Transcript_37972/m.27962 type:complete len:92 (-) Transcript_37972:728-1003(-)
MMFYLELDDNNSKGKTRFECILSNHYIAAAFMSTTIFGIFNFSQYLLIKEYGTGQNDMRLNYPVFVGFLGLSLFYRLFIHRHEYSDKRETN